MTLEKAFGEELQKAREKCGLTQEKLGFESGYHRAYISQLERGQKSPTLKAVFSLSKALNVRPSGLMKNVEARQK